MPRILQFDRSRHDFAGPLATIFDVEPDQLPSLHSLRPDLMPRAALDPASETRTRFHELVHRTVASDAGSTLRKAYVDFVVDNVAPLIKRSFLYQKFPTFRIQFPGEQAVHTWHYDSDASHRHPEWEINFQIAITEMRGNCATWIESVPGLRDFAPMDLMPGECCIFDGNRCMHGNRSNDSGRCRLSLDFRVLPEDRHVEACARQTLTSDLRFVVGEYYELYRQ